MVAAASTSVRARPLRLRTAASATARATLGGGGRSGTIVGCGRALRGVGSSVLPPAELQAAARETPDWWLPRKLLPRKLLPLLPTMPWLPPVLLSLPAPPLPDRGADADRRAQTHTAEPGLGRAGPAHSEPNPTNLLSSSTFAAEEDSSSLDTVVGTGRLRRSAGLPADFWPGAKGLTVWSFGRSRSIGRSSSTEGSPPCMLRCSRRFFWCNSCGDAHRKEPISDATGRQPAASLVQAIAQHAAEARRFACMGQQRSWLQRSPRDR